MQRIHLGRALALAAVLEVVLALVNAGITWASGTPRGLTPWTLGVVAAVAVALAVAVADAVRRPEGAGAAPWRGNGPGWGGAPGGRAGRDAAGTGRGGGTRPVVAVLVLVLVAGLGGWALTLGFRAAFTRIAGLTQVGPPVQTGPEALAAPVSSTSGPLALGVESVQRTADYVRVGLVARNRGPAALSMPVVGNCLLTTPDGTTLEADPRSPWTGSVPGDGLLRGVVYFRGRLPASVGSVSLTFTTVFGSLDVRGVTVQDVRLRPA